MPDTASPSVIKDIGIFPVQGHESPTESRYAISEASVSSVPEELSLEDDAMSRVTSDSHASSSRGVHDSALVAESRLCAARITDM